MDKFVKECFITKVYHFDALKIWDRLKIGQEVSLHKNEDPNDEVQLYVSLKDIEYTSEFYGAIQNNSKSENVGGKVSLKRVFQEKTDKKYRLGNLSKDDSKSIIDIINCGYENIFSGRISAKDESKEENKRIKVAIFIKKRQGTGENR